MKKTNRQEAGELNSVLDRAIVHTGVTRAANQIVLVDDINTTRQTVIQSPGATQRITRLTSRLMAQCRS